MRTKNSEGEQKVWNHERGDIKDGGYRDNKLANSLKCEKTEKLVKRPCEGPQGCLTLLQTPVNHAGDDRVGG